ncbi:MAG: MATE family efflux transporter [Marinicaulis sp.]|nr:MATE family efflux transporter [Marinicaulis sp.]
MRHVIVMSMTSSLGLVSIFLVDFVDLYFISLLGKAELAAAVGFAGTILFFNMSLTIGMMIAMSALAAQRIGRGDEEEARRIATSIVVVSVTIGAVMGALCWIFAPQILDMIGAEGETKKMAVRYLRIVVPTLPIAALAMVGSGLLRAHGDAKRAMNATLAAGAVNAILDPILIFGLSLGLDGAALASVAARFAMMATALYPVLKHYGGFAKFDADHFKRDLAPIFGIAGPAILTNIATPIGAIIVTRAIAPYGDGAVAGFAVISRLSPLAFCVIFALSGAVGPIVGQNFGARNYDRVREALRRALQFTALYTAAMWVILFALNGFVARQFGLDQTGAQLIFWFAAVIAPLFFFNGALFVSNASFNNLNRPYWSTWLNWGRNTIGVIPFVWLGSIIGGAPGVLIGHALGCIIFAGLGVYFAFRLIAAYESGAADPEKRSKIKLVGPRATPPMSSPRG